MGSTSLLLLILAGVAIIGVGVFFTLRALRVSPEKREGKRRELVHQQGRLGDAFITEADSEVIFYEYSVHGVHYSTSQDISTLRHLLTDAPELLIGVANLKYMTRNPANSIVLCEEWSGLRQRKQAAVS